MLFGLNGFGTASLGKIKALAAGVMVVGSALGPLISGFLIDLNYNLNLQYNLFATYFVFSSVLLIMATRKAIATV